MLAISIACALLGPRAAAADPPEIAPQGGEPEVPASEAERARDLPIVEVTFAGNRRVAGDDLAQHLGSLRPGKPFSPEGMSRDLHELWASGLVEDVQIDLSPQGNGVRVRILVRERPSIREVTYTGNHEIGTEDLEEAVKGELVKGAVLSQAALRRAAQKLRDKYAEEGYLVAEAAFEVVPQRDNQVSVRFTITENKQVSVNRITFIGNHEVPTDDLREVMLTGKGGFWGFLGFGTGGPFRQDAFERDVMLMTALYYDRGFLSVQVDTPRVELTPDQTGISVTLTIHEGPRYRIRALRILERDQEGRELEPIGGRRHLREMVRARPGEYFNRAELVKDLGAVQTLYRDAGYANVEVPPGTQLDAAKAEVDVEIAIRRGPPVRFGRVEIKGNTKTRDKVIRREIELHESDLFNETRLERSRQRINALGFFERVDVSTAQGDVPGTVDVHFEVAEKPTGTFQLGAGFSSIENFMLTAQIQQQNLFGRGQALGLNAQISGLRQTIDFRFFEPYLFDSRVSAAVSLFDQVRSYPAFSQTSKGGSVTLGYPLLNPTLRASLTYTLEHDKLEAGTGMAALGTSSAVSVFQRLPLANLFRSGLTSSIRPTLTFDTRDNRLFPAKGVFLEASVEAASSLLGSHNEYVKWRGTGRFYYPLDASKQFVLKLNTELGIVTSPSPNGVPIFGRFFLGGITDVRGFPLRSIGPRLPLRTALDENSALVQDGANIGGNLMYYQNLELEFPILKAINLRGVIFTDLGNTWNLEQQYCRSASSAPFAVTNPCFQLSDLFNVRASWGVGVRWLSPMGPLRFEWGFPFKPLPYEKSMLFEFTVGTAF